MLHQLVKMGKFNFPLKVLRIHFHLHFTVKLWVAVALCPICTIIARAKNVVETEWLKMQANDVKNIFTPKKYFFSEFKTELGKLFETIIQILNFNSKKSTTIFSVWNISRSYFIFCEIKKSLKPPERKKTLKIEANHGSFSWTFFLWK